LSKVEIFPFIDTPGASAARRRRYVISDARRLVNPDV
jgi:hypothetical protein